MTRLLKKFFSLLISSFAVLILSGFIALEPVKEHRALASHNLGQVPSGQPQQAQGVANCRDLTMVPVERDLTEPVPAPDQGGRHGGVFDSGQLDLNQPAPPNEASQACIKSSSETLSLNITQQAQNMTDVTGRFLQGWTWNTNLGWLGFRCINGKNTNDGDCGADINYGVFVDPADDGPQNEGSLRGFAWGDNIGWLSMGCSGGRNVGVNCGNKDYGVRMAMDDGTSIDSCLRPEGDETLKRGDLYGFAWSDSIGWINFCGAHLDLQGNFAATVSIIGNLEDLPVYANGADHYTLKIQVFENDAPVNFGGASNRQLNILEGTENIFEDKVRTNQLVTCIDAGCSDAITFGVNLSGDMPYIDVYSKAPTSESDSIILQSFTLEVKDDAGTLLQAIAVDPDNIPNRNLSFAPAVEVKTISMVEEGVATPGITTIPRTTQEVALEMNVAPVFAPDLASDVNIIRQIYDCSEEYNFVFDAAGDGILDAEGNPDPADSPLAPDALGAYPNIERSGICANLPALTDVESAPLDLTNISTATSFIYTDPINPTSVQNTNALGFQTIVEYKLNGKSVRYYSKKITDGSVLNQAADVFGNVRIDVVDTSGLPATDRIASSIGERAQSKRTEFYRAIKQTLGGKAPQVIVNNQAIVNFNQAQNGILHFRRDKTVVPAAPCKIILDSDDFNTATTIVSEGCDIFIDSDIMPNSMPGAAEPRLGIIALQDFSLSGERRGGNVYLCSAVTDVKANFVLDGSLFSYGESADACGEDKDLLVDAATGRPIFSDSVRSVLKHQLTIIGSLISNNTYGGSLQAQPLLGGGEIGASSAAARLYDINFLRYARTQENPLAEDPEFGGGPPVCWAEGVALSKTFTSPDQNVVDACNDMDAPNYPFSPDFPNGHAIVNIIYRGPSSDMPIFKAVKGR